MSSAKGSHRPSLIARLYAQAQLYDLVEKALTGQPASWKVALRLGSTGVMMRIADEVMGSFFDRNHSELHVSPLCVCSNY